MYNVLLSYPVDSASEIRHNTDGPERYSRLVYMYSMISEMIFIHEMRNTNLWACQTNAEIGGNIIVFHWVLYECLYLYMIWIKYL